MMGRSGLLQSHKCRSTSSWTLDNEPKKDTHAAIVPQGSREIGGLPAAPPRRARLALVSVYLELKTSIVLTESIDLLHLVKI